MSKVWLRQVKNSMSCSVEERRNLLRLGLGHIGMTNEIDDNSTVTRVALNKVRFAVKKRCR